MDVIEPRTVHRRPRAPKLLIVGRHLEHFIDTHCLKTPGAPLLHVTSSFYVTVAEVTRWPSGPDHAHGGSQLWC